MSARPEPTTAAEWTAAGQRCLATSSVAQAIACFEHATRLEPDEGLHWARLAKAQMSLRQHDAAESALLRACKLRPAMPSLWVLLAHLLREQNKPEAALDACGRALALDPGNLHAAVAEAMMLPPIYPDAGALAVWRSRLASGLERLHVRLPEWRDRADQILDLEWNNFYLAYQGGNDRDLQVRYSAFVGTLLDRAVPELRQRVDRRPRSDARRHDGKRHLAFVSSELRTCTIGDYFLRWVTDLPRDRFVVTSVFTGHVRDRGTGDFERGSDAFMHVSGRPDHIARRVCEAGFDAVILPDVGMSTSSCLLSNLRLAPVQCAAWGHPVTTGSESIDHYISCDAMEPQDAPSHYVESLLLLPGIGVRYCPPPMPGPADRAGFGLPADKHIYLCPQSLYKIHPDTDALFIELLARDADATLVFFAGATSGQTRALARRLERAMERARIAPRQQIKFLPQMSRDDFLRVLPLADVMLDPMHWSGGNSTLDALLCGLPVVTLPGRFMRGRQSAAMLRILGLDELIATDAVQYVATALRVAADPEFRRGLSARIHANLPKLFDRAEPIEALANALEQCCDA